MIRIDPNFYKMTPNQLLGKILHQGLVDQDVEKSLSLKVNKSLDLNANSCERWKWSKRLPRQKMKKQVKKEARMKKPPLL
jgi:hypothetical protein